MAGFLHIPLKSPMVITFIGHRNPKFDNDFRLQLKNTILNLIDEKNADTFLFGSRSAFDALCLDIVTEIKLIRPHIKRVYVRASYPFIDESYKKYLLGYYDETYIPDQVIYAGKAAYVERNKYLIDKADVCIFYFNENYQPPLTLSKKKQKNSYQQKSGTKIAYDYAVQKKKAIINLFM